MSRIAKNSFWLLVAQIGGLFIPLIELPILARSLGQESYGQVLYALGIALTGSVIVEFGFVFSAARSVVKVKENSTALAQLVTNVMFAKLILIAIVAITIAGITLLGAGATSISSQWLIWIVFLIFGFGFSPMWYYVGVEKLVFPALWDLGLRLIGLILIILLVSVPQHAWRVLAIQAVIGLFNTLIPTILMLKRTGFGHFQIRGALQALHESWQLFLYKGAQSILGSLASTLLGSLGGARSVGAFVPAEKLVRAATGFAMPLFNVAFPHMVKLMQSNSVAAKKIVRLTIIVLIAISATFAMIIVWIAPWIVNLMFGPDYYDAVELLRILVWIVPLRICSTAMAVLWFIPVGKEQVASRVILLNISIICAVASFLVPTMGGKGMAVAFICAEFMTFSLLLFFFLRK